MEKKSHYESDTGDSGARSGGGYVEVKDARTGSWTRKKVWTRALRKLRIFIAGNYEGNAISILRV